MTPFPSLSPFLRRGEPVPLTIDDYARRADVPRPVAVDELMTLCRAGLAAVDKRDGRKGCLYDLTPAGVTAATRRTAA